ncbi:MAG: radical SAM protein [Desulfobacteraceae bacterium]
MMPDFETQLKAARDLSWSHRGREITFYLPGMISYNGLKGAYPGISITGEGCALMCDHCQAKILAPMPAALTPDTLTRTCRQYADKGCLGVLISGGCDRQGRLPWKPFVRAIEDVKHRTDLYISIHSGLLDPDTAQALKEAGVDQALLDVIGDDETYKGVCHVDFGISRILRSLEALNKAQLPMVPHVICGLNRGEIQGEYKALQMVSCFDIEQLVIVSLMAVKGTPFEGVRTPSAHEVAKIIIEARQLMPQARISLGCARTRGDEAVELLALEAGVNRMALPADITINRARELGLAIRYQRTCCSVSADFSGLHW